MSIYIITHKENVDKETGIYQSIQVGNSSEKLAKLRDDAEINIAEKNKMYAELTAMYWIWKNRKHDDWVGFCHYRRFFDFADRDKKIQSYNLNKLDGRENVADDDVELILKKYDVILTTPKYLGISVKKNYILCHRKEDYYKLVNVIKDIYPEYERDLEVVFNKKSFHICNMFIMTSDHFNKYMEWLFNIFDELEKVIELPTDIKQQRVFGFMGERLLNLYVYHNKFKVYTVPMICLGEGKESVVKKDCKTYIKRMIINTVDNVKKILGRA